MVSQIPPGWFPENVDPATYDPIRSARGAMKPALIKRFYERVSVEERDEAFCILLDSRAARTPARNLLALPNIEAAELIAAEWRAQMTEIDPATMPGTRITHTGLDLVGDKAAAIRDDMVTYARADLLFYRVDHPARLVAEQQSRWDPVLAWCAESFGAHFNTGTGVIFVDQSDEAVDRIAVALTEIQRPLSLAALHVMTTLTGSVLLALAVAHRRLDADHAFDAAELDADIQRELWGSDEEAAEARANRLREMRGAAALYLALG